MSIGWRDEKTVKSRRLRAIDIPSRKHGSFVFQQVMSKYLEQRIPFSFTSRSIYIDNEKGFASFCNLKNSSNTVSNGSHDTVPFQQWTSTDSVKSPPLHAMRRNRSIVCVRACPRSPMWCCATCLNLPLHRGDPRFIIIEISRWLLVICAA